MTGDSQTAAQQDVMLEAFVAELTHAAYRVALRGRMRVTCWLDLELDLWKALADTVKTSASDLSRVAPVGENPPE
jgi:hypothetical protein